MTPQGSVGGAHAAPGVRCWNVCVDHQPRHAGLYRGICDFATALSGGVLSFDSVQSTQPYEVMVRRIKCGQSFFARRCHALSDEAVLAADTLAEDAELLAVHSLFRAHCKWAWQWAQQRKRPYWAVPHGCLDPLGLSHRKSLKQLWLWRDGQRFFGDSSAVIFATHREMAKAAKWLPGLSQRPGSRDRNPRGVVIPWPVQVPSLEGRELARVTIRRRLGIPLNDCILLWVGRFHESKRPLHAIRAFAAASVPNCHLVMVGIKETLTRGDLLDVVPQNASGRIHVIGELRGEALAAAWLSADGYISLSAKENFSYSTADALAYGLPVILSAGHDLAYELPGSERGKMPFGWLLPDDALDSPAQAITEWGRAATRSHGDSFSKASVNARAWVAENLSFERFRGALEALAETSGCRLR